MNYKDKIKNLYQLKKEVEKSDNTVLVNQINEIIKKIHQDQVVISFIGHFSSGKSSLINHIFGEHILPSSPVPTTSNTAQIIISDQENVRINLDNHTYSDLERYEDIKKVNTLNHEIESVEIYRPSHIFENNTVIQDTPGIDATFKNHAASTMKFLLISDVVFYTVEYNHVNSEKNFEQIKALNELNVPVVLVINQIDKHQDSEISFEDFKSTIADNIERWDLKLERTIFTSIFDALHNEIDQVPPLMNNYAATAKANKEVYFERMIQYIESSQLTYLQQQKEKLLSELNLEAEEIDGAYQKTLDNVAINEEQSVLTAENNTELLLNAVKDIIKNAYLMPFEMREKIREMLETYANNYKVPGLFGKKAKLISIQEEKVREVLLSMNAIIEKQITFQLKEYYSKFTKYLTDASPINTLVFEVSSEDITSLIKPQETITNDYVLIYSDQLKNLIERMVINQQKSWHEQFIKNINMSNLNTNDELNEESVKFENYFVNESFIKSISSKNYLHYYIHVDESIDKLIDREYIKFDLNTMHSQEKVRIYKEHVTLDENLDNTTQILNTLSDINYFEADIAKIHNQIQRLNNNITKIVVFGAFSAGKSAMINALLKQEILVSSPNPTTASITEIQYGTKNFVTFKSEQDILKSLNDMMYSSALEIVTIPQWIKKFKGKLSDLNAQNRNFAEAIMLNYEKYEAHLKNQVTIKVSDSEIDQYTANDTHAAFVKKITLGIQNEFLKDKIIIDSPGTGSTNSRHTKETTEIIADSDLLIYVSYYNHVYTEKDKAFLSYLNEVEVINDDSQNFFVINAVDLAKDDQELQSVINYLSEELLDLGIADPIYPVSSRDALISYDDNFSTYKAAIEYFVKTTSKQQKIKQINHHAKTLLNKAQSIVDNFETYEKHIQIRNAHYKTWMSSFPIDHNLSDKVTNALIDMLIEQTTYLKDKMKIQLYDALKSEINTSSNVQTMHQSYLHAVQNKLNEELYLIMPRLNKNAQNQFNQQVSIISNDLEQHEIYEDLQFKNQLLDANDISISQITNTLHQLKLPNIKQKQLMNPTLRSELYDNIHAQTLRQINEMIESYKSKTTQLIYDNSYKMTEYIDKKQKSIEYTINDKLAQKIDPQLKNEVSEALKKLEVIK
ncbi:dynamin family protein [Macrococcus equi]|uniref:dynamin family protein n=1 Tax=Macrococcus equi TaxID=3395462 RepID=UPI0039BECDD6